MKHPKTLKKSWFPQKLPTAVAALSLAAGITSTTPVLRADDAPPPSRVHALLNVEFSDKYLTPRGMIVTDTGLTTQVLFLAFVNLYSGDKDAFINSVTLIPGFWNDFNTSPVPKHLSSPGGTNWIEYDPILGLEFGLPKGFKLDVTYTEFAMQILDIGTSQHLETKLSFDDSGCLGAFALHPYVIYWKELDGKSTAAANFGVPDSYYFEVGVSPGWSSGKVKFEVPARVLLPSADFYGETFGDKSTVALFEVGVKASGAANFMPQGYGHWSWHAGIRYVNFIDDNLKQLATDGGFGSPTDDTVQIYAGFSSFF